MLIVFCNFASSLTFVNPAIDKPETPSRQEVKNFLENKKLEEYSNRYIKNLRSRALIEKKI